MKSSDANMNIEMPTKLMLDQNVPIEELLGSVTTYNSVEGSDSRSLQLRTSARVFKKMKLDSANAAAVTNEKKEPIKEETKSDVRRPFKKNILWSQEDKNLFFEALNEYGKDFEAIQLYIAGKLKKKGLSDFVIKSKDQIRYLYYRTWHKISKHLRFSEDVKKVTQELYALINYGELRKKVSVISVKTCVKLNELIYRGSVALRVKGKTLRIKTPMCRALRKLNQLDENNDDLKLPTRVTVELRAKDMITWMRVQDMAQNPRVKTALPLQKRLSSLISCLSERWKTQTSIEYEKATHLVKAVTDDTDLLREIIAEHEKIRDPLLRLSPPKTCNVEVPAFNLSEYLTSQSICLNAYEERIGVTNPGEQLWLNSFPSSSKSGARKSGAKRVRNESTSEKTPPIIQSIKPTLNIIDSNENCLNNIELSSAVNKVVDEAVKTILALKQEDATDVDEKPTECLDIKMDIEDEKCDKKKLDLSKLKDGWTLEDCGTLSIGDLYLMFGSDSKLVLEYSWDNVTDTTIKEECDNIDVAENETNENSQKNADVSPNEIQQSCSEKPLSENTDNLSVTLKRLLSVAKLHYRKNIIRCPCGHVCGSPSKPNAQRNKNLKNIKTTSQEKICENLDISISANQQNDARSSNHPLHVEPYIRRLSPTSLFRRPSSPNDILKAQLDSIQRLKPRYCNRRGRRPRTKQVVVERKLLANRAENGRQIVQMNIISRDNLPSPPRPIAPKPSLELNPDIVNANTLVTTADTNVFAVVSVPQNMKTNIVQTQTINISDNATTPSRVGSPTSISNLIDMALTSHGNNQVLRRNETGAKGDGTITSFVGLLSENIDPGTPPSSPSRILKENENQWLNAEVADFSLSSFLGHLESPLKHAAPSPNLVEDTRLCLTQDVDAHLQSLLTESSLDYTAKFADLAAEVTDVKK